MHKHTKYVIRGSLRKNVLGALMKPNTPTILARKLGTERSSVSRSILFLLAKGLVESLNPDDKRGRLYVITNEGKKVLKDIKEMEGSP